MNLLDCMEMLLNTDALIELDNRFCFLNKGVTLIKYERALKLLAYDNSMEQWTVNLNKLKAHPDVRARTRNGKKRSVYLRNSSQ